MIKSPERVVDEIIADILKAIREHIRKKLAE